MKENLLRKFSIENKVAVITGTTRGIGEALCQMLIESGCRVIAIDRSDNSRMSEYSKKYNVDFKRVKTNLLKTTVQDLEKLIDSIYNEYGSIDILVNCAGITRRGEVEEFATEDWNEVIHMNLTVPFHLSKLVSKYMIRQKYGKIVNIASMLSFQGGLRVPSYASSKHGIVGLTKSFSNGLAKYGINVNAVAPGFIRTEMTQLLQDDPERNKSIESRIPTGRWGEPDDIKGALYFLSSPMSDFINGIVLPVDGGWLSA